LINATSQLILRLNLLLYDQRHFLSQLFCIADDGGLSNINQLFIQQKLLVVPDNVMDYGALLGHDLNRKFIFCCDDNGFKLTGLRVEPKELDVLDADVYNIVEV